MQRFTAVMLIVLTMGGVGWSQPHSSSTDIKAKKKAPQHYKEVAKNLAIISGSFKKGSATRRRYEFLLPRLSRTCNQSAERVGDMVVAAHGIFKKAGLEKEEPLLKLFNNFYRIANGIEARVGRKKKLECAAILSMYTVLRTDGGYPADHSIGAVTQFVAGIMKGKP